MFPVSSALPLDDCFPEQRRVDVANGAAAASLESDNGEGGATAAIGFAFLASGTVFPAPSALPLAEFFPVPRGFGLANSAAVASSESDDGGGAADACAMATATAAPSAAAAVGDAVALAASLVERGDAVAIAAALVEGLTVGVSPTAGTVAFGGSF